MRLALIILVVVLGLPASSYAKDWEVVRQQGMTVLVVVAKDKEAEESVYRAAIRDICKRGQFCKIMFWSNKADVPLSLPMTDKQATAQTADYVYNPKTRFDELLWNCRIVNDPSRCFD